MNIDPRKYHYKGNNQDINCFNLISECSTFLITLENGNDFYADCDSYELDIEKPSNRKWVIIAEYFAKKFQNYKIAEITAC